MKKRVKSKTSKKDSSNLKSALIVFILLALALILLFNITDFSLKNIGLNPPNTYSGLPEGFEPEVAYYSPFAGGLVGLWDGQSYYIANDGTNFINITRAIYTNLGLPSDFTPDTGYAHNIQGGLVGLWDNSRVAEDRYYVWNGAGNFFNVDLTIIPVNEIIILGYAHNFSGIGRVTLFNDRGEAYLWDSSKGTISKLDRAVLTQFGLPTLRNPQVAYYYNFNGMERVDIWYGDVLYRSSATPAGPAGNFAEFKTVTGISGVPTAGYWDKKRNKIVVWVGPIAYESSNGNTFELIYDGTIQDPPECTATNANTNCDDGNLGTLNLCTNNVCENPPAPDCTTNSQCATNQVCSNNICVSGATCVDHDGSLGLGTASDVSYLNGTLIGRDSCDTSGFILTEWYCNENGEGDSFEYECIDSCSNGKCVGALPDLVCRDSDDGDDENEFGIIELIDDETEEVLASFRDSCISDRRVNEFSCNGDEEQSEAIRCSSSKICRNGECVTKDEPNSRNTTSGGTSNNQASSCIANTERCSGTNTEICLNSAWINIGNQEGKCGYHTTVLQPNTISCNSNSDCDSDEICNDSGRCQFEQAPDDLTNLYIAIGVIIFIILVVLGAIIFITIKNKNKRENHPPKTPPAHNNSINFNQPGTRGI